MRGYGDSGSFPDVKDYHLDILADDIRGVIDALGSGLHVYYLLSIIYIIVNITQPQIMHNHIKFNQL